MSETKRVENLANEFALHEVRTSAEADIVCEHCHKPHDHAHHGYVSELCRECCIKTGFHN